MVFLHTGPARIDVSGNSPSEDVCSARDRLLRKISDEADLPALGSSVSRVVQLASSNDESVRSLAHFILSDVALTQKILRIANTVRYRTASGMPITTVSRAIFLLGFETVKTSALAMLLVDAMAGKQGQSVRAELSHALSASIIGREMARRSHYKDAEEVAIAALFKNIGRLLVAAHDHKRYEEVSRLVESGDTLATASLKVLGCTFDLLTQEVLQEWQIPESIIQALAPLRAGPLKPAKGRHEWLQQAVAFSTAAATVIPRMNAAEPDDVCRALLARFGPALDIDQESFEELYATVTRETRLFINHIDPLPQPEEPETSAAGLDAAPAEADQGLPEELLLDGFGDGMPLQITARHASGKPINARDLLLAGVQDVTEMMATGRCKINDLLLLVLETLYTGLGFRFAVVCLRDVKTAEFRARIAMGEQSMARQAGFVFPGAPERDLFHLAMENDADLMIADAAAPKIVDLLPAWHRALLPDARSFIVLPLVVNKKQIGLFYADRARTAPEGVPPDETTLIRTLKGQVLAALSAR